MTSADLTAAPVDELAPRFHLYDPARGARLWGMLGSARSNRPVPPGEHVEMARGAVLTPERSPVMFDHC
jgi:hypothetical protein